MEVQVLLHLHGAVQVKHLAHLHLLILWSVTLEHVLSALSTLRRVRERFC